MHLQAPAHWRCIDFISDLHLQASEEATFSAWRSYLQSTKADALFILGDLFEVWVGDDVIEESSSFEAQCAQILKEASKGTDIYVMRGNRDFLLGTSFMQASGCTFLEDITVLHWAEQNYVLVHGDAQCLDDVDYMQFRALVRSPQWQTNFLGKPLSERKQIARGLREQSESRKRSTSHSYIDVDTAAALELLTQSSALHLIHGHTHQPARHTLGKDGIRDVLSDWDVSATPPRCEVLRLQWCGTTGVPPGIARIDPVNAAMIAN
jgi:UDP-2,3-diacylglucosamine hydrolase